MLSQGGRNINTAKVCIGTESHAMNWNNPDPAAWRDAHAPLSVPSETALFVSAKAEGYKPMDLEMFELHEGDDSSQFKNIILGFKPGGIVLSELPSDLALYQILRGQPARRLVAAQTPRLMLEPERSYPFELIDPSIHQLNQLNLYIEPGVFKPFELPEIKPSVQPIFDERVRAPWRNSLQMAFINVPGHTVMWSQFETRLADFLLFCQETELDFSTYETELWDHRKADREFVSQLPEDERARYEALSTEERKRFIEQHPIDNERQRRLQHPLTQVSLAEMVAFGEYLTKRGRKLGFLPPGFHYRLPTDQEFSAIVGLEEPPELLDPEQSGLTLLNLVEAEVLSHEELNRRNFDPRKLGSMVTREKLDTFEPDTRELILNAVRRQQLNIRIDRVRTLPPVTVWRDGEPREGVGNLEGSQFDPYHRDTAPVEETPSEINGIHGLMGNVSETTLESIEFYQMVLRGPSWTTNPRSRDRRSNLNLRTRMLVSKGTRNPTFGFRLVLAPVIKPTD